MEPNDFSAAVPVFPKRLLPRTHLYATLEKALAYRLTVVAAPTGYGKTALLSQFVRQKKIPVVWHTAEPFERDPSQLFNHCVKLLQWLIPQIQNAKYRAGSSPDDIAFQITRILREQPTEHTLYVLDNADELFGAQLSRQWLQTFINSLPSNWHLILVSQVQPPIDFAELVAQRNVFSIGRTALRFDRDEIVNLAELSGQLLNDDQMLYLDGYLSGWPAGVSLALQSNAENTALEVGEGETSAEQLFSVMASQLLSGLAPHLRRFLLASSTLTRMTPQLCSNVLKIEHSQRFLAELEDRNLFSSRGKDGVVYHALFRDFLQDHLSQNDHTLFTNLHEQAGAWFESNLGLEEAIEHYFAADEIERSIAIVERVALSYHSQGKLETLLHWSALLESASGRTPKLEYACAMIDTTRYNYDRAKQRLETAKKGFAAKRDEQGEYQTEIEQANILNQRGDYRGAAENFGRILEVANLPNHLRGAALLGHGWSQVQAGLYEDAIAEFETAHAIYQTVGDDMATCQLLYGLEIAYTKLGRLDEALNCVQEAVSIQRQLANDFGLAQALNNLGCDLHMIGEYEEAQNILEEGVTIAARINVRRIEAYLYSSLADVLRDRGAFDDAHFMYERALALLRTSEPALQCSLLLGLSTLARWQHQVTDAYVLADEAFQIAQNFKLDYYCTKAELFKCAVMVDTDISQVHKRISVCIGTYESTGAILDFIRACSIGALVALAQDDSEKALHYFGKVLLKSIHPSQLNPLAVESVHEPILKRFIEKCVDLHTLILPLQKRLEAALMPKMEKVPLTARKQSTYDLRVYCLGRTLVERDGSTVMLSEWKGKTAQHIFFYILLNGITRRDTLALAFWPDDTDGQVRDKFHTHMLRARRALGEGVILFDNDAYKLSPLVNITCDALEFMEVVKQARHLSPRQLLTEDLWRRAVNFYQGDLLPTFDAEWVTQRREAYRQAYLESLLGLGNCLQTRGAWKDALFIYERGLGVDAYREEFYQGLMVCLARLGRFNEVKLTFEQLTSNLERDLGAAPSQETATLLHSLLH